MDTELKEALKKRLFSFFWRLGSYVVVSLLALLVDSLGLFNLSPQVVALIALICGELTKLINNSLQNK
jgi:hypothetical protein